MSKTVYSDYLKDIIESVNDIENFTKGMNFESFSKDKKTVNAVIRSFEVIGEAAKNISPETRKKLKEVPWEKVISMRNKMIHEYFGVDIGIIWKTVQEDLPELKAKIKDAP